MVTYNLTFPLALEKLTKIYYPLDINEKLKDSGLDESILFANGHAPSTDQFHSTADVLGSSFGSKSFDQSSEDEGSSETEDETSSCSDGESLSDDVDEKDGPSAADWYREHLGRFYKAITKVCLYLCLFIE